VSGFQQQQLLTAHQYSGHQVQQQQQQQQQQQPSPYPASVPADYSANPQGGITRGKAVRFLSLKLLLVALADVFCGTPLF
jgi:hypothetical protein